MACWGCGMVMVGGVCGKMVGKPDDNCLAWLLLVGWCGCWLCPWQTPIGAYTTRYWRSLQQQRSGWCSLAVILCWLGRLACALVWCLGWLVLFGSSIVDGCFFLSFVVLAQQV